MLASNCERACANSSDSASCGVSALRQRRRVAQVVVAVDQRDDARRRATAARRFSRSGKPLPSACSWCCASTSSAPGCQAHAPAVQHAVRHVVAVGRQVFLAEALVGMAQPLGQVDLADVVHQRADAQVEHLVVAQAEDAAHQQRDHGHVHGVRTGVVAGIAGEQADAHVAVDQHLVEQRARQVLGVAARLLGARDHAVLGRAPGVAGFVELASGTARPRRAAR